jgi:transglutaminase-like putative cysteine protease
LYLWVADSKDSGKKVEIRYQVQRVEKAAYAAATPDQQKYLNPERLVPINENFRQIAEGVVKGKTGDLVRAQALYDHVIDRMRYTKYWGAVITHRSAGSFLGTQGDIWDTQEDMFTCFIGSIVSLLLLARMHNRQLVRLGVDKVKND